MLARAILGDRPLAPALQSTPSGVGNSVLAQAKVAPSATLGSMCMPRQWDGQPTSIPMELCSPRPSLTRAKDA